jgi:Outer membrane protein transport protein (OMPP1/FadL/TodX)
MKKILCLLLTALSFAAVKAQTASDALRFSYIPSYGGTARTIGVGGAMGALGGDFATVSMNPAGLATYRMSEFTFTPAFHAAKAQSELLNSNIGATIQRSTNFSTDNLGLVFAHLPRDSRWKTVNYSFGYNRFQDFNSSTYYEGSTKGSMTARWRDAANIDKNFDAFEGDLAAETGAIYKGVLQGSRDSLWLTDFDADPSKLVYKNQVIETSGSLGEMSFALAGNYNDKLQLGFTVGVPILRYTESKIYKEADKDSKILYFDNLQYDQNLTTSGSSALFSGVNVKLGAIVRPTQSMRIGFAVHSPTTMWLNDRYDATVTYGYTTASGKINTYDAKSPEGNTDYKLTTPWRALGSFAYLFGKSGFLSADVEWADYSKANFGYDKKYINDQNEVNRDITLRYKSAINARFGGEYAYDIFRLRAGVGLNTSPRTDKDFVNMTYSAGAGLRGQSFFMDLGWQTRRQKENYTPYKLVESQANQEQKVTNAYVFNDFLLTFGIRF